MFVEAFPEFPPPLLLVLSPPANFRGAYRYFRNHFLVKSDRIGLDAASAIAAAAAAAAEEEEEEAPQKGKQCAASQHPLAHRTLNG
jgi:hypothetical protein